MTKKYDIAILGWWHNNNYGSMMTYYALKKYVEHLGYSTLMVNESLGYPARSALGKNAPSLEYARRQGYNFTAQSHFSTNADLNNVADTFLIGSDQLWNPYIPRINDDLFLNFTSAEKKRIAYGVSLGNFNRPQFQSNHFGPDFENVQKKNIERFDAISMREGDGVDYLKKRIGAQATQVVDPVFLIDTKEYRDLASRATKVFDGSYMLAFILDPNEEKRRNIQAVADKLGYKKIVVYTDANSKKVKEAQKIFNGPQYIFDDSIRPENWLRAYQDAGYVVTDSFHGSAFCHIFQKPFSVFFNKIRGENRFVSLMKLFRLGDTRRIYETDDAEKIQQNENVSMDIDFSAGNENLLRETQKSAEWLIAALRSSKDPAKSLPGFSMSEKREISDTTASSAEIKKILTNTKYVYYRHGERHAPMARGVTLLPSGEIAGIKNSVHSFFWDIKGGRLEFLNRERRATTSFGIETTADGALDIRGEFIPNRKIIHVLEAEASWSATSHEELINAQRNVVDKITRNDAARFLDAYAMKWQSRNIGNAKALMMFYAHAVEKGLSHSDFRAGFGKEVIPQLARETNKWLAEGGSSGEPFFKIATSVMKSYFEKHDALKFPTNNFRKLFSAEVMAAIKSSDPVLGGAILDEAPREDAFGTTSGRSFIDVAYGRRSVRNFKSTPVPDEDISKAIHIAMQAPSVCNRQPARVYDLSDPEMIRRALEIQVGFRGFPPPPRLLLVTADLNAFLYAGERNQAYIDGGLFMMMLLLGLEEAGLSACCLNTAMNPDQQDAIRKLLNVPHTDVLIAFAAVGYPDDGALVPRSRRVPVENIWIRR